jgi:hypothetical protein
MKSAWVVVVLVCVVLAGSAWAQIPFGVTPRAMGMGLTGVGIANDAAAWFQNPAGLAGLDVPLQPGNSWANDLSASYTSIGLPASGLDAGRVSWSSCKPSSNVGVGAGYGNVNSLGVGIGAGVGVGIGNTGLSLGINVLNLSPAFPVPDETLLNAGAMLRISQGGSRAPIRIGANAINVTNELGAPTFVNAGISWPITNSLLVAADVIDLTEEITSIHYNAGAELTFGAAAEWAVRVGLLDLGVPGVDTQLTAGLGYKCGRWRVDGAYVEPIASGWNSTWTVGAGWNF